jgi:hypothetical protein
MATRTDLKRKLAKAALDGAGVTDVHTNTPATGGAPVGRGGCVDVPTLPNAQVW